MIYQQVAIVALPKQDLIRPPAALPVLASICEQADTDYTVWDFNLWLKNNTRQDTWDSIDANWIKINSQVNSSSNWFREFQYLTRQYVDIILETKPDLIAISVFTYWSAHAAWEFIQAVRARSSVKIVIGGSGITALFPGTEPMCNVLLNQGLIDYYIHGEGEISLLNLLKGLDTGPGINNLNSQQIQDLDLLPLPSYKKINPRDYNYISEPSLTINGSRGCVRACSYCDVAHYWPKFRYKSGQHLAEEIYQTWKTTGITNFEFSDSLINGSIREFRCLNKKLIELRSQDSNFQISYQGQFICRSSRDFKEVDYQDMAQAGCRYLYVGVETFSDRVRSSMKKKFDSAALDFHIKMTAKYGIPNVFLMIVGYPTETLEDHQININGLEKYQHYAQAGVIDLITFGFTTSILEHTPLDRERIELEIVPEFDNFTNDANWVSLRNPTLTFKERVRRWVELTETADRLGYRQPRISAISERLYQVLDLTKNRSRLISIIKESSHD